MTEEKLSKIERRLMLLIAGWIIGGTCLLWTCAALFIRAVTR